MRITLILLLLMGLNAFLGDSAVELEFPEQAPTEGYGYGYGDNDGGGSSDTGPATLIGADAVLAKLLEAKDHPPCSSPPCKEGRHVLEEWEDLGEEMSHVQGAVVVRRPDLTDVSSNPSLLAPAEDLDFVRTLQSYFPLFESSLLSRMMLEEHDDLLELAESQSFLDAVRDGNDLAGAFLYTNYASPDEVPTQAEDWHGSVPTVVSMADVVINSHGFVWNEKDFVAPNSCLSTSLGLTANTSVPRNVESFEKVVVMTQTYGEAYYHILVENLSRITVVLDILLENPEIKVAAHGTNQYRAEYLYQLLELLGIERDRVLLEDQVHADLAIIPTSNPCGKVNDSMIMMLRHALLQALYPETGGVPPTLARPVILLIVRNSLRGLANNDDVREALQQSFPSYDVVEFKGEGPVVSQLQTFATASVVVAPHGAGLSNTVVSPLHTPVLEIAPINCPTCFVHLVIKLQHLYARHPADRWDEECRSWYEPDVDEVVNLVRDLLEAKRQVEGGGP